MKISYNAPFTLTFTFISALLLWAGKGVIESYFVVYPRFDYREALDYFRLFSHAMGHADWDHFLGNFSIILLLGPMLEEKYTSGHLAIMAFVTALVTGIANVLFFNHGLLGASGIVFMMILLSSFGNMRTGKIPLTFLLVLAFYLGQEFLDLGKNDHISHVGHIIGGSFGGLFGFLFYGKAGGNEKVGGKKK